MVMLPTLIHLGGLLQVKLKGRDWFDNKFAPRIGPIALLALLYTIFVLFALQGHSVRNALLYSCQGNLCCCGPLHTDKAHLGLTRSSYRRISAHFSRDPGSKSWCTDVPRHADKLCLRNTGVTMSRRGCSHEASWQCYDRSSTTSATCSASRCPCCCIFPSCGPAPFWAAAVPGCSTLTRSFRSAPDVRNEADVADWVERVSGTVTGSVTLKMSLCCRLRPVIH